ncbi:MAG: hypothetical protein ABSG59_01130 [Verrucomicrobiota bacterium]|jgi:hypothetical protein
MSIAPLEPLPLEVGQLGNFEERMTRTLRMGVEDWDEVCSALGAWEASHLTGQDTKPALEQHRAWVTQLIAWGQVLEQATGHAGFSDRAVARRVKARLRHLQDKLALWHTEMTPDEEARILRAAFP